MSERTDKPASAASLRATVFDWKDPAHETNPSKLRITLRSATRLAAAALLFTLVASCGGSDGGGESGGTGNPGPYAVSVTVSNLQANAGVELSNSNGAQSLTVTTNGTATFPEKIPAGGYYSVTVENQPADENCTVTSGSGTVTGPTNITVSCTGLPATISAKVIGLADVTGLSLQDNGGDTLAVSNSGTYQFKTQIPSGGSYSVTIQSQPAAHTCFVTKGAGTVTSSNPSVIGGSSNANVEIAVVCPWHVGYATYTPEWVFGYYVDQATGALTEIAGDPYVVGVNPSAVAVAPGTQFLYVAIEGDAPSDGSVSGFVIDHVTGTLSPIAGSPFTVGLAPNGLAADMNGKFLYVSNSGSNTLSAFAIDASTGTLTAVPGSPFSLGGSPLAVTVDPTGSFVYAFYPIATAYGGPIGPAPISVYSAEADFSVDAANGELTPIAGSPFLFPNAPNCAVVNGNYQNCNEPTAFAVAPSGKFLYVALTCWTCFPPPSGGLFAVESINATTGALSPGAIDLDGSYGLITSMAIHPSGKFLYAGNPANNAVYGFALDASTGLMTPVTSSVQGGLSVNPSAQVVSVDPSGHFLYANFTLFDINTTTGALTSVAPAPASPTAFSSIP